jgi:hypothetical protein
MDFNRLTLLEQRMGLMQKETSEVLMEMQATIQLIAKTYSTALQVVTQRLDALEKGTEVEKTPREETNGKEL